MTHDGTCNVTLTWSPSRGPNFKPMHQPCRDQVLCHQVLHCCARVRIASYCCPVPLFPQVQQQLLNVPHIRNVMAANLAATQASHAAAVAAGNAAGVAQESVAVAAAEQDLKDWLAREKKLLSQKEGAESRLEKVWEKEGGLGFTASERVGGEAHAFKASERGGAQAYVFKASERGVMHPGGQGRLGPWNK